MATVRLLSKLLISRHIVRPIVASLSTTTDPSSDLISKRIEKLVNEDKIVVFMKGTPDAPQCGFSNAVVKILEMHGLPAGSYKSHDVLEDEEIRGGVKIFSDWPTIPQVYFKGEFIGGCDVLLDMHKNGSIIEELKKLGVDSPVDAN